MWKALKACLYSCKALLSQGESCCLALRATGLSIISYCDCQPTPLLSHLLTTTQYKARALNSPLSPSQPTCALEDNQDKLGQSPRAREHITSQPIPHHHHYTNIIWNNKSKLGWTTATHYLAWQQTTKQLSAFNWRVEFNYTGYSKCQGWIFPAKSWECIMHHHHVKSCCSNFSGTWGSKSR